jgi:hypothetical protein
MTTPPQYNNILEMLAAGADLPPDLGGRLAVAVRSAHELPEHEKQWDDICAVLDSGFREASHPIRAGLLINLIWLEQSLQQRIAESLPPADRDFFQNTWLRELDALVPVLREKMYTNPAEAFAQLASSLAHSWHSRNTAISQTPDGSWNSASAANASSLSPPPLGSMQRKIARAGLVTE